MTKFTSNYEAKKTAEKISGTIQVFYTNEGLEINFTASETNQQEIVRELKKVFSDVKLKGRKVKSIIINKINETKNGIRTSEVEY